MEEEKKREEGQAGGSLNRRRFIGALGAAAAAGALLNREGTAQNPPPPPPVYYYEDSFGNILQANPYAVSAGVYPPDPSVPTPNPPPAPPNVPQSVKEPHEHGRIHAMEEHGFHARPHVYSCGQGSSGTYHNCGYPYYNILLIMVDQMRSPLFWPPNESGGQQALLNATPYISGSIAGFAPGLINQSYVYQNYFNCANHCSPARSTFLTGLYTQQNGIYKTQNPKKPGSSGALSPSLLPFSPGPGFPTIGDVLSQMINIGDGTGNPAKGQYDCAWIGKWHLSCLSGLIDGYPGEHGPIDYGFGNKYNIPTTSAQYPMAAGQPPNPNLGFPSPNGMLCEGNGGDFLDSLQASALQNPGGAAGARNVPSWVQRNSSLSPYTNYVQLNDSAIASAFVNYWLPNELANTPGNRWFCAVSFVNPHDIATFPWAFGVTGLSTPPPVCDANTNPIPSYCTATSPQMAGYNAPPSTITTGGPPPPPVTYYGTATCSGSEEPWCSYDQTQIASFNNLYTALGTNNAPSGWNNGDDPIANPYGSSGVGKPGYQAYFENQLANGTGIMNNQAAWLQFLNYYIWLEASVDQQVGAVLNALKGYSAFNSNTVIIFTSDHGEYAGSHNLHDKGGGVYDEGINPPFFVSFPGQRGLSASNNYTAQTAPVWLPYCCSSVDVLPFLYTLALGNNSWRGNSGDPVYYLNGREAMMDAILYNGPGPAPQHRLSGIPLHYLPPGYPWALQTQPYILSTCDEDSTASVSGIGPQPSHVIGFRTVDITDPSQNPNFPTGQPPFMYGGGKLGIYSYWDTCAAPNVPVFKPINPNFGPQPASQYEFYNYSTHPQNTASPNPGETGNQAFTSGALTAQAQLYVNAFNSSGVQNELYNVPSQLTTAVQNAFCLYWQFLQGAGLLTGADGNLDSSCSGTCP